MSKWECPQQCPYQADDSKWPHIRLFLLTVVAVGILWGTKIYKQQDIEPADWGIGLTALVLASNHPETLHKITTKAANKLLDLNPAEEDESEGR
jgi:hypothetical protein